MADESKPVGTGVSEPGMFVMRRPAEATWKVADGNQPVPAGDLVVGFSGATLDSENGAVRLTMRGDLNRNSPYPIIENAVVLHEADGTDLNFTLDRGRVDVVNRKASGAAHVRMKVRDAVWDLTLLEPGAQVAFETYGRWPRGARFSKELDPKIAPTANLIILVLKGQLRVKQGGYETVMSAPPGPALLEWDSVSGRDESPVHLDQLPAWAQSEGAPTAEAQQRRAVIARFRQALLTKGADKALDEFLDSDSPADRGLAVFVLGALDNLPRLGKALREAKHFDVWDNGVVALRHWVGRKPGQDQILYNRLIETANYKPKQAEAVVQLLHSFGDEELARPEVYQTLIDFMEHDLLAIRGLAYWHLYRLVPAGRELGYNPLGPKEQRDEGLKKWRELIPPGTVPSRTTSDSKK
jgi:hypothetical protein